MAPSKQATRLFRRRPNHKTPSDSISDNSFFTGFPLNKNWSLKRKWPKSAGQCVAQEEHGTGGSAQSRGRPDVFLNLKKSGFDCCDDWRNAPEGIDRIPFGNQHGTLGFDSKPKCSIKNGLGRSQIFKFERFYYRRRTRYNIRDRSGYAQRSIGCCKHLKTSIFTMR